MMLTFQEQMAFWRAETARAYAIAAHWDIGFALEMGALCRALDLGAL